MLPVSIPRFRFRFGYTAQKANLQLSGSCFVSFMSSSERRIVVYRPRPEIHRPRQESRRDPELPSYNQLSESPPSYEAATASTFQNAFTIPVTIGAARTPHLFHQYPQASQQGPNQTRFQLPPSFTFTPQMQQALAPLRTPQPTAVAPTTPSPTAMAQPVYIPAYNYVSPHYPYGVHPASALGTHPQAIVMPYPATYPYVQYPPVYYPSYYYPATAAYQPYVIYPQYYVRSTT
ncbi:hypothetical protein GLAREA_00817 [Glarea lozoyensis ATCC 20868]|uniref:Uncharacterized protein n=1 Tax=Glarea lozoyensis (strain ATCC 20868 / MF5171) TaxID=1116229 RepID=S3CTB7_GLAL2|nr:uncharacterized protein GLAREA_00817 [Glarea lozoyensis ATCC 20868]EPE29657.1 hypothetical protein GLAREA_00817 [Glarea lozoyensis ATCC 20868]